MGLGLPSAAHASPVGAVVYEKSQFSGPLPMTPQIFCT